MTNIIIIGNKFKSYIVCNVKILLNDKLVPLQIDLCCVVDAVFLDFKCLRIFMISTKYNAIVDIVAQIICKI